jgi:hypothetical protein
MAGEGLWNSPNIEFTSFEVAGEISVSEPSAAASGTKRGTPCTASTNCARPPAGTVSTN